MNNQLRFSGINQFGNRPPAIRSVRKQNMDNAEANAPLTYKQHEDFEKFSRGKLVKLQQFSMDGNPSGTIIPFSGVGGLEAFLYNKNEFDRLCEVLKFTKGAELMTHYQSVVTSTARMLFQQFLKIAIDEGDISEDARKQTPEDFQTIIVQLAEFYAGEDAEEHMDDYLRCLVKPYEATAQQHHMRVMLLCNYSNIFRENAYTDEQIKDFFFHSFPERYTASFRTIKGPHRRSGFGEICTFMNAKRMEEDAASSRSNRNRSGFSGGRYGNRQQRNQRPYRNPSQNSGRGYGGRSNGGRFGRPNNQFNSSGGRNFGNYGNYNNGRGNNFYSNNYGRNNNNQNNFYRNNNARSAGQNGRGQNGQGWNNQRQNAGQIAPQNNYYAENPQQQKFPEHFHSEESQQQQQQDYFSPENQEAESQYQQQQQMEAHFQQGIDGNQFSEFSDNQYPADNNQYDNYAYDMSCDSNPFPSENSPYGDY